MNWIILLCLSACYVSTTIAVSCTAFLSEVSARSNRGKDICHEPFKSFLDCLTGKIEAGVHHVIAEASPAAQQAAKQCFGRHQSSCSVTYDEKAALDAFLPCPYSDDASIKRNCVWRYVADEIISLLKDTPKPVGACMIRYFKGIGERKIEQCTQDYPPTVSPQLIQPPIAGFENFEAEDIKNVLLYHVMTRYYLGKCTGCNAQSSGGLINCLANQAKDDEEDACSSRQNCEQSVRGTNCESRYNKVHDSVCTCAKSELKKGIAALEDWDELKKTITRGDWECQMEICWDQTSMSESFKTDMRNRVQSIKINAVKAYLKFTKGEAPPQLAEALYVFKSILDELVTKWSGIFCGDCNTITRDKASEIRKDSYEKLLRSDACKDASAVFNVKRPETLFSSITAEQSAAAANFFGDK